MYFPTAVAKRLSHGEEVLITIAANSRKNLFLSLSKTSITLWRVRPPIVLATLSRSTVSLHAHGQNVSASWSPDGGRIVVQTTASHLVLIKVQKLPNSTPYQSASLPPSAKRRFLPGPGEAQALAGYRLALEGVIRIQSNLICVSPRSSHILFTTSDPPAVQRIPWPSPQLSDEDEEQAESSSSAAHHNKWLGHDTWLLEEDELPWLVRSDVIITSVMYNRNSGVEGWITSDGRAYFVSLFDDDTLASVDQDPSVTESESASSHGNHEDQPDDRRLSGLTEGTDPDPTESVLNWSGVCIHGPPPSDSENSTEDESPEEVQPASRATVMAFNLAYSMVAVGTEGGNVHISNLPINATSPPRSQILRPPTKSPHHKLHSSHRSGLGSVLVLEWTSDGYALAVGWEHGWGIYSLGGRCLASSFEIDGELERKSFEDSFMTGVNSLFWVPGNMELFVLAEPSSTNGTQLFSLPFAKSAATTQQSPDNTRYAVLQLDETVLIYRGADQPDMSVINPEADVWQHVKIPLDYMAHNWPVRYTSISSDGRLVAVAGRRGLLHWSAISGRWKSFADNYQEQSFAVKGGLVWFNHVLVAAVEFSGSYQVQLYSRDLDLASHNILHREMFPAPVALLSLIDNSLLVYTVDNTLYHFLIVPTHDNVKLQLCGSISFEGIIAMPSIVRGLSWMIPPSQKHLGNPVDDLTVATVLLLVGGRLVLLRPRKIGPHEVKYDMQILAERIEFCWIHLGGIGALENSLWGFDGNGLRVWLDALTIEAAFVDQESDSYQSVQESVNIPMSFYPLSVLMDKGIIIGVEYEAVTRTSLPFTMFRTLTSTHLFLPHVLKYYLGQQHLKEAVAFASTYQHLVFFAHALEVLLHTVLEAETETEVEPGVSNSETGGFSPESTILPLAIEFLDHFDSALDVVVGCARKTEVFRWRRLFDIVGNPKTLFETCLESGQLKTAGSYLLVLHNLEQLDETNVDAIRVLRRAIDAQEWTLCRELLHFLRSIDDSGAALTNALEEVGLDSLSTVDGVSP